MAMTEPMLNPRRPSEAKVLAAFLYRCPNTGKNVQGFAAEELCEDTYEATTCLACRRLHFVSPKTGKVLGEGDEE
jgi:hypothetical protein